MHCFLHPADFDSIISSHPRTFTHSLPQLYSPCRAAIMASNSANRDLLSPHNNNNNATTISRTRLIFTYGTLKRGFYNHRLMESLISTGDASFIGECTTKESFPLVIGPYGIPFLINLLGSGHRIPGELYAVSDRGLARLDELEGIETGHYERLPVDVVSGDGQVLAVEGYFGHRSFGEELWRKNGEKGLREFGKEMAEKYVVRANRPLGSNFVDDVWKFISA
ncbi:putative gamma-glutamylcyclotransferase At3g02910 [Coffea arabica]|uniref:Gamma-glutamylcyclotransferase family protein n=1 Tax=Coffea arabica TaxID=13443 RepID=A0ABM4VNR0_COFAR|nr:putative gamma-glutamylcyclotransferase At3g02910 [Coffea arabica]